MFAVSLIDNHSTYEISVSYVVWELVNNVNLRSDYQPFGVERELS